MDKTRRQPPAQHKPGGRPEPVPRTGRRNPVTQKSQPPIFGQWLRAGTIDHDQYRAFAAGVVSPTCVIHFCQRPTQPASSVCAPCQEETKRLWENRKLREKLR